MPPWRHPTCCSSGASTGFGKEGDVSLKKPFARLENIIQIGRMRVKEITRLARTNRPAAIVIVVVCVLATAMLLLARPAPHRDARQAVHTAAAPAATESAQSAAQPTAAKSLPRV